MKSPPIQPLERLAVRVEEFAKVIGCGDRKVQELLTKGLPHFQEGRVVLIPLEAAKEYLNRRGRTTVQRKRAL